MKYQIEVGDADYVERSDETYPSRHWEVIASGQTYREVLEYLLRRLNDDDPCLTNSWLRLVEEHRVLPKVTTF